MKIHVTQDHINDGLPDNCSKCPIALAVSDALKARAVPFFNLAVRAEEVVVWTGENNPRQINASLPDNAQNFIEEFDSWDPTEEGLPDVAPFEFEISF